MAACSLTAGSVNQYWTDGVYYHQSGVSGTKANLRPFNPDPVFSTKSQGGTSFWVMINYSGATEADDRVAQVGWVKASDSGFNDPYIFLQVWSDSGGIFTVYANCSTNAWGSLYYRYSCKADSNYDYQVEKNLNTDVFTFTWGTFPAYSLAYSWDPNRSSVAGEITNHGNSNTSALGDHYPGAVGSVVQATSPRVRIGSGGYSSVNYTVWNPHTGVAAVRKFGSPHYHLSPGSGIPGAVHKWSQCYEEDCCATNTFDHFGGSSNHISHISRIRGSASF